MDNAFLVRFQFTSYSTTLGEYVALTPTGMYCEIVNSPTSTVPITGLGPFAMQSSAVEGEVYKIIPSSAVESLDNTAYIDRFVYLVVRGGDSNSIYIVTPLMVTKTRTSAS
jgi:hypothetical protein